MDPLFGRFPAQAPHTTTTDRGQTHASGGVFFVGGPLSVSQLRPGNLKRNLRVWSLSGHVKICVSPMMDDGDDDDDADADYDDGRG